MGKKLALSFFYNLCIFICLVMAFNGFVAKRYDFVLAVVFGGTIFVILKIRQLKDIRNTLKP